MLEPTHKDFGVVCLYADFGAAEAVAAYASDAAYDKFMAACGLKPDNDEGEFHTADVTRTSTSTGASYRARQVLK